MQLKVKLNIDPSLPEEKAEFWLKKMTARFERITKELNSEQDFLWCYRDADAYEINFSQIYYFIIFSKFFLYKPKINNNKKRKYFIFIKSRHQKSSSLI